jgi:DNA helicase-2/ATP-dependent DNA helicase PcrA
MPSPRPTSHPRPAPGADTPPSPAYAADLDDEQRRAVEFGLHQPERPLIVLAGPGTGKTRVITHRIARLVEAGSHSGPVEPERILGVTFTVNAAEQMRDRLAGLVGPAAAARVNIHTFHAFGALLLRRFGDHLGLSAARLRFIDSALRTRLLVDLMARHGLFRDRLAEGRHALAPEAAAFIDACRDRAITPERCEQFAAEALRRAERNPDGLSPDAASAALVRARDLADKAALFRHYDRACRDAGWVTFHDFIALPIRLLAEHPAAAAIVRDDYRHLVVDEFQDVNPAQVELLRLLAPPDAARPRDLCVVGDDDQAIYGFRGASQHALRQFARLWPDHHVAPLTGNYRSAAAVLDVANDVIRRAAFRFDPGKTITVAPRSPARGVPGVVEGVLVGDDREIGAVIAAALRRQAADRPDLAWRDHAVLVRSGGDLERIGADLEVAGIPVRYLRPLGAMADPVILDLLAWISLVADPAAVHAAQRLLARPPFPLDVSTIADWVRQFRAGARPASAPDAPSDGADDAEHDSAPDATAAAAPGQRPSFVDWLERCRPEHPAAARIVRVWRAAAGASLCDSAAQTVLAIIDLAGLAHPPIDGPDRPSPRDRARTIARLVRFLSFVRSRQDRLDPPGGLPQFLDYFNDLTDDERNALGGPEDAPLDRAEPDEDDDRDAVRVLTAHRAKGLEFDTVFVANVRPRGFPTARSPDAPVLPDDLRPPWDQGDEPAPDRAAADDEERRLFYVACTRARRRLVLLAERRKGRSRTTDYFAELTGDRAGPPLLALRDGEDILADAAPLEPSGASPADAIASAAAQVAPPPDGRDAARLAGAAQVRALRARIAHLLDRAEHDALDDASAADLAAQVAQAAARLPVASHLAARGEPPPWALADTSPLRDYAAALASRVGATGTSGAAAGASLRAPTPPLRLSYTALDVYRRCPRCYYLRFVLGLADQPRTAADIGQVAHDAIARFYLRHRDADADGRARPTLDDLLAMARDELSAAWPRSRAADPALEQQLLAQVRLMHQRLHRDDLDVIEIEREVIIPYPRNGLAHSLRARIDRIDRDPDGSLVIVDYKTGEAWKRLLQPPDDDLQFGIYALALSVLFPDADLASARAEYWLLATGQRGVLPLADLRLDKVHRAIDAAIDGILAARFGRGKSCPGPCNVLPLDDATPLPADQ